MRWVFYRKRISSLMYNYSSNSFVIDIIKLALIAIFSRKCLTDCLPVIDQPQQILRLL